MSKALFLAFLISLSMVSAASAHEYRVGGPRGWVKPNDQEETETYNDWAGRNRFHIGDSLCKITDFPTILCYNVFMYSSYGKVKMLIYIHTVSFPLIANEENWKLARYKR